MQKNGLLITAYEDVQGCIYSIKHHRKFLDWPIVVVSTAHKPEIIESFNKLMYTEGVQPLLVKCIDAPGNPGYNWESPKMAYTPNGEIEQNYISWRHEYIAPRVLKSMSEGFYSLLDIGCNVGLHLHSDTLWNDDYNSVGKLKGESERVYEAYASCWDICEEDSGNNIHIHPEGLMLDLEYMREKGALDFFSMYSSDFKHYNWGSIESLIGSWCHYKFFGECILDPNQPVNSWYKEIFSVRCKRPYHGIFNHLNNLPGVQPDATNIS